jgi:hypothetical protein
VVIEGIGCQRDALSHGDDPSRRFEGGQRTVSRRVRVVYRVYMPQGE